jgi:hypothetical protein
VEVEAMDLTVMMIDMNSKKKVDAVKLRIKEVRNHNKVAVVVVVIKLKSIKIKANFY